MTLGYIGASIGIRFVSCPRHLLRVAGLVTGILLPALNQAKGATIDAKSGSLADVSSAIASAHDGDTVVVPAGTASWTSTLSITKGITLRGAGYDATVILDDIPRGERRELPPKQGQLQGPRRAAPFARSMPLRSAASGGVGQSRAILISTLTSTQSFRMTGFTFRYGSITTSNSNGLVRIGGTCPSVRIDHCHFDQLYGSHLVLTGCLYGVIDHCIFDARPRSSEILNVFHTNWGGGTNAFGDGSWADPPYFGSEKFIFIEDCVFNNVGGKFTTNGAIDSWFGGRYVCRYNTFHNTRPGNHGTETGGRSRSCRAMEIYNNTITYTIKGNLGQIRGGTALIHDNTYVGLMTFEPLVANRTIYASAIFGGATGNNSWDFNDTKTGSFTENGFSYNPVKGLYASGTHTGANSSQTLVVSGAGWATNQWVGFEVTNLDLTAHGIPYYNSRVLSNTSDTITCDHGGATLGASSTDMVFNTGNRFEIRRPSIVLDQCGRGQGDLLASNPPINKTTNSIAWPHEALEPIYAWNNTLNGAPNFAALKSFNAVIQENRDFYNNTPKPGYKPYTYPHPLTTTSAKPGPAHAP